MIQLWECLGLCCGVDEVRQDFALTGARVASLKLGCTLSVFEVEELDRFLGVASPEPIVGVPDHPVVEIMKRMSKNPPSDVDLGLYYDPSKPADRNNAFWQIIGLACIDGKFCADPEAYFTVAQAHGVPMPDTNVLNDVTKTLQAPYWKPAFPAFFQWGWPQYCAPGLTDSGYHLPELSIGPDKIEKVWKEYLNEIPQGVK